MARWTLAAIGAVACLTLGCSGSGDAGTADASPDSPMSDGSPGDGGGVDSGDRFDPSMTYPGEGTTCEFSLFCEELQICVDAECIRHERVEADELEMGPFRNLFGPDLQASPLYTRAPWSWEVGTFFQGVVTSQIVPGSDGPITLFFLDNIEDCLVGVYGRKMRVLGVEDMLCTAAGAAPDGTVIMGGLNRDDGRGHVAVFGPDDVLLFRGDVPSMLDDQATTERGETRAFGAAQSFLWDDGGFIASFAVGQEGLMARWGPSAVDEHATETGFVRVALDGSMSGFPVGGSIVHDGARGWLVRDPDGVKAILLSYWDGFPDDSGVGGADLLVASTGERTELYRGPSDNGRYSQPREREWFLTAQDIPELCQQTVFSSAGVEFESWWVRRFMQPACSRAIGSLPSPWGGNGGSGALVTGNEFVLATSVEGTTEGSGAPWDYDLYFEPVPLSPADPAARVERLVDPPEFSLIPTNPHHAASRFGKTYEVFGGGYNAFGMPDESNMTWWEAALRRIP